MSLTWPLSLVHCESLRLPRTNRELILALKFFIAAVYQSVVIKILILLPYNYLKITESNNVLNMYDSRAVQLLSWLCEISPFGKQVVLCLQNENIINQWLS